MSPERRPVCPRDGHPLVRDPKEAYLCCRNCGTKVSDRDPSVPVIEKDKVPLVLSKIVHADCGSYRIEYYPEDLAPSFCPACGRGFDGDTHLRSVSR